MASQKQRQIAMMWKPALIPLLLLVLVGLGLGCLPLVAGSYVVTLAFFLCVSIALAESYNLVGGYLGYMNLGHSGFFGVSAYTLGPSPPRARPLCGRG